MQKYLVFLFFVAITSEMAIAADGQQFNKFEFEERPLNKLNVFDGENTDGIIIIAALRRRGGKFRGKYRKLIDATTEKAVKVDEIMKVTTEETVKASTKKVVQMTTEEAVKVTNDQTMKSRRNEDNQNALWIARKRVTRPPRSVPTRKKVKVIDEEDYSVRRARYLFTQRLGKR